MRFAALAACCFALGGCAGGSPDTACEVFDPPPAASPTAQDEQRMDVLSTGDPTINTARGAQDCD